MEATVEGEGEDGLRVRVSVRLTVPEVTSGRPGAVKRMFSGLRSVCASLIEWRWASAWKQSSATREICASEKKRPARAVRTRNQPV